MILTPTLTLTLPQPSPCLRTPTQTRVWRREEEDIRLATVPFLTAENDLR